MSAYDAVDGARSAASKRYRLVASKPERFIHLANCNQGEPSTDDRNLKVALHRIVYEPRREEMRAKTTVAIGLCLAFLTILSVLHLLEPEFNPPHFKRGSSRATCGAGAANDQTGGRAHQRRGR